MTTATTTKPQEFKKGQTVRLYGASGPVGEITRAEFNPCGGNGGHWSYWVTYYGKPNMNGQRNRNTAMGVRAYEIHGTVKG